MRFTSGALPRLQKRNVAEPRTVAFALEWLMLRPSRRCRMALWAALMSALMFALAAPCARADLHMDTRDLQSLLDQPVYAASKFAQDAADAPASVSVLTAGDIRAYGWRTLADVLNGVRGVHLRNDRFYNYIGVRGLARPGDFNSRLLVLIDGMRVNDNIYGQAGIGREFPLDVALIERVEFVPGPGSALYGSNAVQGVVNIFTKSAASLHGLSVGGEMGSDQSRALRFTKGLEVGATRWLFAGSSEVRPGRDRYYAEFDAPATNFGLSSNADRETDRKLYAKWVQGDFTAAFIVSDRLKQIPTGAFETVFPSAKTQGVDRYRFVDLQWQRTLDTEHALFVRATLARYHFRGRFDYGPFDGVQSLDQRGRWFDVEARWQYRGWRGHQLGIGVELQHNFEQRQRVETDAATGWQADIDDRSRRWGLFVNDEIQLAPGLRAVLGARLDRQLSGEVIATPRLAWLWQARPGLMVKLLNGRAYREPNAYEAQYQDNAMVVNPSLRSESLRSSELALDWRLAPHLRLAASMYRNRVANLIEQQADPASGLLTFNNVGAVDAEGLELEADHVHGSGWRLRGSLGWQRARSAGSNEQISNAPRSLAKLNLSVPLAGLGTRAGLEWQRVGQRRTLNGQALPAHAVAHLSFQYVPPGAPLSLSASLYNLFDKRYADPGGPDLAQDALAQDGRQWRLQMTWHF